MADIRRFGFMGRVERPFSVQRGWAGPLREHPAYHAAKAGDPNAAVALVAGLVPQPVLNEATRFGPGCTFVAPHAIEASGRTKIPQALAIYLAEETGEAFDTEIIQSVRAFHTGASRMERLISRPEFDGPVTAGTRYVVVDDVTTSGSTLAELADHIHRGGGEVVGAVVIADASRTGRPYFWCGCLRGAAVMSSASISGSSPPPSPRTKPSSSTVCERLTPSELEELRRDEIESSACMLEAFRKGKVEQAAEAAE